MTRRSATDDDRQADLLEALAGRGLRRGFARLALAAGEFPVAGIDGPGRALADQERSPRRIRPMPTGSAIRALIAELVVFEHAAARGWPP